MLEIKKCVTPSPEQWEAVIHGMRNAFKSWDKADSEICLDPEEEKEVCYGGCPYVDHWEGEEPVVYPICYRYLYDESPVFVLGKNDRALLIGLCTAGDASHRKALRQLPVIMQIKAPLYWWKQMDQYKVGTVTNSESTMHTMTKEPFKIENFEIQHFLNIDGEETNWLACSEYEDSDLWFDGMENHGYCFTTEEYFQENFVNLLNSLRIFYLKTNDMKYWYAINELLPQSYYQTRLWSGNYETCVAIIKNRIDHKLEEWRDLIRVMLKSLPYLLDIVLAMKIVDLEDGNVTYWDSHGKERKALCKKSDLRGIR